MHLHRALPRALGTTAVLVTSAVLSAVPAAASSLGGFTPKPTSPTAGATAAANTIIGVVEWASIAVCLIALIIGGAMIGYGRLAESPHVAHRGRQAITSGLIGAVVIGGAVALIGFAFNAGIGV